jgi:hypothetical protein
MEVTGTVIETCDEEARQKWLFVPIGQAAARAIMRR